MTIAWSGCLRRRDGHGAPGWWKRRGLLRREHADHGRREHRIERVAIVELAGRGVVDRLAADLSPGMRPEPPALLHQAMHELHLVVAVVQQVEECLLIALERRAGAGHPVAVQVWRYLHARHVPPHCQPVAPADRVARRPVERKQPRPPSVVGEPCRPLGLRLGRAGPSGSRRPAPPRWASWRPRTPVAAPAPYLASLPWP